MPVNAVLDALRLLCSVPLQRESVQDADYSSRGAICVEHRTLAPPVIVRFSGITRPAYCVMLFCMLNS